MIDDLNTSGRRTTLVSKLFYDFYNKLELLCKAKDVLMIFPLIGNGGDASSYGFGGGYRDSTSFGNGAESITFFCISGRVFGSGGGGGFADGHGYGYDQTHYADSGWGYGTDTIITGTRRR